MQRAEKIIEIDAPLERVFDLFSDFESFPRWMRNIKEVRYTGRGLSRWTGDAPLGMSVEWEAETTVFEPDHRILWRSVRGDVDTEGEVVFEETRRGTTMMRVVIGYGMPAGRLGAMFASLFGKNPEQQLEEDLERFAEVAEGRRRRSDARRVEREPVERTREAGPAHDRREYVREQIERRRRSLEDREHEERARVRDHERRRGFVGGPDDGDRQRRANEDDERSSRRHQPGPIIHSAEDDGRNAPQRRHALTPRERETEGARRRPDDEYSGQAFRRGVERLMDEPPSKHWRRWEREE
jgi:uncharacterized protein YndB with AHSA1/START domain